LENWTLGLCLIGLTITMHAAGIALGALKLQGIRVYLEHRELRLTGTFVVLVGLIGTLGLLLVILHGLEAAAWAVAYRWLGALDSAHNSILYSPRCDLHSWFLACTAGHPLAGYGGSGGG
jgi:hypothetical protein